MTSTNKENFMNSTIKDNSKKPGVTMSGNLGEYEEILPFCLTYLTPALIKQAEIELHETEENKTRCLREFRNFIQNQKNLVTPTDDLYLLSFLRARKYDLERTYKLFLNFWKFRKDYRVYFDNINVEDTFALLFRNVLGYLEHRDKNGASVVILRIGYWNPELDPFESMFIAIVTLLMLSLEYPGSQIAGIRVIIDFRGLSWAQMKYCTPYNATLLIKSTQFCFPARYRGFHVITGNKLFRVIWRLAYPLLTLKMKKRLFLLGSDLKPIRKYIHPSVLPVDFGGDAPAFETMKWKNHFHERVEKLLEIARCGYKD